MKSDDRNEGSQNFNKSSFYKNNATSMGSSPQRRSNKLNLKS